eukprot:scaffold119_cov131-Cylindrotheca_fusiformis.AAC.6
MATIFKSLLSKTLTTFLYKYLSDVDVQGIALPSVIDGSGWGVRLSNVKLREGVQLMKQMPGTKIGKRKRTRIAKRKKRKAKARPTSVAEQEGPARSYNNDDGATSLSSEKEMAPNRPLESYSPTANGIEVVSDDRSLKLKEAMQQQGEESPSTPPQDSKSLLSCFYNSASARRKTTPLNKREQPDLPEMPILSVHGERERQQGEKEGTTMAGLSEVSRDERAILSNMEDSRIVQELEEDEYEEYEEEYEAEYKQQLTLCLGENGSIGTLDVRLVDKNLHVLVEDAVLTIEAIPMPDQDENLNDGDETFDAGAGDPDDSSAASGPATQADPRKSKPTPKEAPKRDTVGERVLADNALARIISAIPHLFLRDVRVRLIVRHDPPSKDDTGEPNPQDTMVEIGIDFLSVTSAEDILSHFQEQMNDDDANYGSTEDGKRPSLTRRASVASIDSTLEQPEYLFRHIRTGKGPDAGVWIRIFVPEEKMSSMLSKQKDTEAAETLSSTWAGAYWAAATDYYLLRCSGLDIRGRIYLGTRKEADSYSWWYDDDDIEYDDFALDSMFMGVDHVAPGPQLPLPPMRPTTNSKATTHGEGIGDYSDTDIYPENHPRAETYLKDKNGIRSCKVPSNFHRVSRGMIPGSCKDCRHLPSEDCSKCWEAPEGARIESTLDGSIPMPGLALQLTIRDPLEINADRSSLDAIGLIRSIFQKQLREGGVAEPPNEGLEESSIATETAASEDASEPTEPSSLFGRAMLHETDDGDRNEAFSTLMQPESIQVLGIHLAKVVLRVHVMQEDRNEKNYSFCYWKTEAECVSLDQQRFLPSPDSTFGDLKLEVGFLNCEEYRGVEQFTLLSTGISSPGNRGRLDSQSVVSGGTMEDEEDRKIWPCTAGVMLNMPPPPETLVFRDRDRHGVQVRLLSMQPAPQGVSRSLLNVHLGVTFVDAPWSIIQQIGILRGELVKSITAKKLPDSTTKTTSSQPVKETKQNKQKSWMTYTVQIDNLDCKMEPKVNVKLPRTRLFGERSSESGLFIQALAEKLKFAWGQESLATVRELSLHQLAAIPENVRMRILLCLDDIQPLEEALYLKKEANPFKRCRNVNKGIAKRAKKLSKSSRGALKHNPALAAPRGSRRQEILRELLQLDGDELDELWSLHQKHQRKLARKRVAEDARYLKSL